MVVPHALVVPYPAQGHVDPLMELSHRLAKLGILVTFVHTEFSHAHVMAALPENCFGEYNGGIRLVTIPDGAANDEERRDRSRFFVVIKRSMPSFLEELIVKINEREENKITYVIVDGFIGFLLNVAEKLKIPRAAFFPASTWQLAILLNIGKLLDSGFINHNGSVQNYDKAADILEDVHPIRPKHPCWVNYKDVKWQVICFKYLCNNFEAVKHVDHILCNSFSELELPVFRHLNGAVPIGPLLSANRSTLPQPSSFWAEDLSCIDWLDQQPNCSVIYVSFGSMTVLRQQQISELALGLELTGRPFLWVCRPDLMEFSPAIYPDGFLDRVSKQGRVVNWTPQKEVLSHPSVACFLTHCGWNSALEGLSNGVPMLCWPYFFDQFQNQTYIVELWKVGLALAEDSLGIVRKEEIKEKIEDLIKNDGIRKRVTELKDKVRKAVMDGSGVSTRNLECFASTMKGAKARFTTNNTEKLQ
ncbi:UDP-glycosyltransferase 83A1-like [Nymphaea colorata]|nr:UDP-glycosyltransferase 83A1-like [Nymphaea colorata]